MKTLDEDEQYLAAKVAFAMKLSRTALGMSQAEFGQLLDVSKPTIVRIENLETPVKLSFYSKMVKLLAVRGIRVDGITHEGVTIEADQSALSRLVRQTEEDKSRRSQRITTSIIHTSPGKK